MIERYRTVGKSIYGKEYQVRIYEIGGSYLTPSELYLSTDIMFETHGNDRDITENIYTATATVSIFLNSEDAYSFFTDLSEQPEGVFYLELRYDGSRVFMGRILGNGLRLEDVNEPFFTIQAIDGLTLLKNIDYVHPGEGYQNLIDIFRSIITKIDTVQNIYVNSDIIIYIATNLDSSVSLAGTMDIWKLVRYNNYFYTLENDNKEPLSCWDVLNEMLQRHNLQLRYQGGIYIILGKELSLTGISEVGVYTKNGFNLTTPFTFTPIDIEDTTNTTMLQGGSYYFEPGIKSITIETDKYHTSKNLADGIIWRRADTTYRRLGLMMEGSQYSSHVKISFQNQYSPSQIASFQWVKIRFYFRSKEWNGTDYLYPKVNFSPVNFGGSHYVFLSSTIAAVELEDHTSETAIELVFKYSPPMDFVVQFIFEAVTEDREMEFRNSFVSFLDVNFNPVTPPFPVQTELNYKITHEFSTYPIVKSELVRFYGETNTTEIQSKTIKILAPDTYGSSLAKPILWNGSFSQLGQNPTDQWRFDDADDYESIERAIIRNLLRQMGTKQMYLTGNLNVKNAIPSPFSVLLYKDNFFRTSKISWNLYTCIMSFTGIRIILDTPTITVNMTAPEQNIYAPTFLYYENVLDARTTRGNIIQNEFDVTGDSVNLDDDPFGEDFLVNNIAPLSNEDRKAKLAVYKNGVKLKYVDPANDPLIIENGWSFNLLTNDITFGYDFENDHVEVIYYNL